MSIRVVDCNRDYNLNFRIRKKKFSEPWTHQKVACERLILRDSLMSNWCVFAYLGDAGDHVGNEGLESGDGSSLLVGSVPHSESDPLALFLGGQGDNFDLNCFVVEWFCDLALWTLDSDDSRLDSDRNVYSTNIVSTLIGAQRAKRHLPSGTFTQSSLRITLMLLISSFINK